MRSMRPLLIAAVGLGALPSLCAAQAPPGAPAGAPSREQILSRLLTFDRNQDGRLTRDEIPDERLLRLFDRADADRDGVATREELTAVAAQIAAEGPPAGGPGGFGPGGRGGFAGPPEPGQILPPFLRERLKLTADQTKQLEALQKEVDARLAKILTDDQKKQLAAMRQRGPGGTGGFGRRGGPGGFGRPGRPPGRSE